MSITARPHTLTLLPTYRCSAACKDCCFQSNPGIRKRADQSRLLDYIRQAADLEGMRLVCISGGEPFMLGRDLVALVQEASNAGLMTRVVTNGFWATSREAALRRLEPVVEAGLNEVNFSTGDDHVEFVSLDRVLEGLSVAAELGLTCALMLECRQNGTLTRAVVEETAKKWRVLDLAFSDGSIPLIESPWMPFRTQFLLGLWGARYNQHLRTLVSSDIKLYSTDLL